MKQPILFTHNDLDGVSCGIIARLFFPSIKIYYCDYTEIDDKILSMVRFMTSKTKIVISDISYKKENDSNITKYLKYHDVYIADHHMTSLWLRDKFDKTRIEGDGDKCGAVLLMELLSQYELPKAKINKERLDYFLDNVNKWDTWTWVSGMNKTNLYANEPLWFNNAMYVLGNEKFHNKVIDYITGKSDVLFDEDDNIQIEGYNLNQDIEIRNAITFRRYGLYHSEHYKRDLKFMYIDLNNSFQSLTSLLASEVKENDVDFIMLRNKEKDTGSLRYPKQGVDLSIIASELGGGGHKAAAGFNYTDNVNKLRMME